METIELDSTYRYNLVGLAYLAEANFLVCEKIYKEVIDKKENRSDFLLLAANNAFFESVGTLFTLLCSRKKEEVRIRPMLEKIIADEQDEKNDIDPKAVEIFISGIKKDYPNIDYWEYRDLLCGPTNEQIGNAMAKARSRWRIDHGLEDLNALKEKFEKGNFHKIRHQTFAHKNHHLDAPAGAADRVLFASLITDLGVIVRELKINMHIWFDYSHETHHIGVLNSLDEIIRKMDSFSVQS